MKNGDEAMAKARAMVETIGSKGDQAGVDAWLRIIVAISLALTFGRTRRQRGNLIKYEGL